MRLTLSSAIFLSSDLEGGVPNSKPSGEILSHLHKISNLSCLGTETPINQLRAAWEVMPSPQ